MFPIPTSKNRMMNTFIILYFTSLSKTLLPHARDSLENKFMLSIPKGFPSPFSLTKSRIYSGTHFKEVLTNVFSKLPEYFPFQDRQSRQECEHFATG